MNVPIFRTMPKDAVAMLYHADVTTTLSSVCMNFDYYIPPVLIHDKNVAFLDIVIVDESGFDHEDYIPVWSSEKIKSSGWQTGQVFLSDPGSWTVCTDSLS